MCAGQQLIRHHAPRVDVRATIDLGALLQECRTGAFFAPQSDHDGAHTREHRGALGGVVAQPADMPIGSLAESARWPYVRRHRVGPHRSP